MNKNVLKNAKLAVFVSIFTFSGIQGSHAYLIYCPEGDKVTLGKNNYYIGETTSAYPQGVMELASTSPINNIDPNSIALISAYLDNHNQLRCYYSYENLGHQKNFKLFGSNIEVLGHCHTAGSSRATAKYVECHD